MAITPDDVLKFWFEDNGRDQWFGKEEAFDDEIRRRFGELAHRARDGKLERWVEAPRSCLALIMSSSATVRHTGTPVATVRSMRLADEPCQNRRSPSRQ